MLNFIPRLTGKMQKKPQVTEEELMTFVEVVEEEGGMLHAYEFKYAQHKVKAPKEFLDAYKESTFTVINSDNYLEFVTK